MQGGYLKAETGEFIDNGVRPSLVVLAGGQWERLELISGEAPREGRFEWKEPHIERSFDRTFSLYDYYGVFTSQNTYATVICTFHQDRKGAEQFSSVTAIPDDWKTFVKPAYEYYVRRSADFAELDLNGLRKLAAGENPLIALTAIRELLSRSKAEDDRERLVDLVASLPKFQQAVLTLRLLKSNDDSTPDVLRKAIRRVTQAAGLRGIALGLESWIASHGRDRSVFDPGPGRGLGEALIERWRSFDQSPAGEELWKSWPKILVAPDPQKGKDD